MIEKLYLAFFSRKVLRSALPPPVISIQRYLVPELYILHLMARGMISNAGMQISVVWRILKRKLWLTLAHGQERQINLNIR